METLELLPTPQAIDAGQPRQLRMKTGKRNPNKIGNWRGDLKDHLFSRADFPASHSAKLDEERERQMTATSGRKCYGLYENLLPYGSSVKMLAASLLGTTEWYSDKCSLIWKVKGTKSKHLLFQLYPLIRRTAGIESGLLPTPDLGDRRSAKSKQQGVSNYIKMLKTSSASEGVGGAKIADKYWNAKQPKFKLRDQIGRAGILPTPNARDTKGKSIKRDRVPDIVEGHNLPIGQQTGLKLQPAFVEWMMGFPEGWTEIPDSKLLEMRLFRKLRKKSLKR